MSATINISLPESMYQDMKTVMSKQGYASVSEFVRSSIRVQMYPHITGNGFTTEFEDEVLRADATPTDNDKVLETPEDVKIYFKKLRKKM